MKKTSLTLEYTMSNEEAKVKGLYFKFRKTKPKNITGVTFTLGTNN